MLDSNLSIITIGDKKIPNIKWKHHQTVAATKEEFQKYYNLPTTRGFGICTGFNKLEVLDIDLKVLPSLRLQQDFWNEYVSLLKDNIDDFENKFVIYKTINNGYHIIYRCEEIGGNEKIAKLEGHTEAIIETRGNGGYAFVYENQISKKNYNQIQEISIHDREVLFECSRFFNHVSDEEKIKVDIKTEKEYKESEIKIWDDFNSKNSAWDIIQDEFSIVQKLSDKILIRRNGAKSSHSGCIFINSGCVWLFSTGTIYPNEKLLSPYILYTYKYHRGNNSESCKDLYSKGYGSRIIKEVESLRNTVKIDKKNLEFPIEIFPIKIQNYFIECNKTLNSSIDYMGCSMLWLLSVIIGNSFKIKIKNGWLESSNIWISIVGKAGIGKTPSISNVIFPLTKINNSEIKSYIKAYLKYEVFSELDKKEKENVEEIKKPFKTQFIVNDITQEALIELHEENKNSVGVFKDELAGWFKDMNKYRAGSDLEFWLSSWSNKGISLNRKTAKSSFVESPIIPVLGGIQPSILTQFFTDENKENGFIDRMLTCYPELDVETYNENELEDNILTWYNDYMVTFYQFIKKERIQYNEENEILPYICYLTKDAKKEWKRIFNDITNTQNSEYENEYMKSMLPKQKSYIPRFMLLLHIFEYYDNKFNDMQLISKETVLKAEKLSKYFVTMAKKIKIDSATYLDAKNIIIKNKEKSNKEKTVEILKNNPEISKKEIAELLGVSLQMVYKYLKDNE